MEVVMKSIHKDKKVIPGSQKHKESGMFRQSGKKDKKNKNK